MTSLPDSTSMPVTTGIDVAKAMLDIAIGVNVPPLSLTNDSEGFEALLGQLATHKVALVVMEATGGLETAAAAILQAAGYAVAVINPDRLEILRERWDNWRRPTASMPRVASTVEQRWICRPRVECNDLLDPLTIVPTDSL